MLGPERNRFSQDGQTELEFMLVLPFFLAVVFGLLMFVMLVFKGQMLTYATYMAGRTAAVRHPVEALGDARNAARQVLPGVNISIRYGSGPVTAPFTTMMPQTGGTMTVVGSYRINPLVNAANTGMVESKLLNISAEIPMHHFQSPRRTAELLWNMSDGVAQDDNVYTLK